MSKRIIVTGTSRGIGFELVKILSAEGHQILAVSRNSNPVDVLKLENVTSMSLDLTIESQVSELGVWVTENWGAVDVLINNAGGLVNKPFMELTLDDFEKVYRVNVFGVAAMIRMALPLMSSEGHVLTISSMGGIQGSLKFPGLAAYSSSKGAVITMMELLAEEFKEDGPSFNVLALGAVQTEMLEEAFPGYKAPVTAAEMATYIADFSLNGQKYFNGKILQVSNSTP
ncbi:SDR family NAD(P)-dependent oxidoreductase [Robertkochia solimangrovi]|uniref:SDR family NAD(P)-dependent oxidoreductase n=1 Tax=Robertkochia solimangrovi TaxID=2213046 RepID=UPI00117C1CDF|nr:SDR family oxidoreductase [Robertkochia solimangrovi]TRZ44272.1 short-chain dehydrogenase [Robertkochia solimangrovi]